MAKVKNLVRFSEAYGVSRDILEEFGVLDSVLTIDTRLFIDPLLFQVSSHPEFRVKAAKDYREHFERVITLLSQSKSPEDVAWRNATRQLTFHEIRGTCLGYGASSISGSGFGKTLTQRLVEVGKEIVDLGIRDPDLFQAMALFEEGIGPDRISDMATNIALDALTAFNQRVVSQLGLKPERFQIRGRDGYFLQNVAQEQRTALILVPLDILRDLPIAQDWDEVADAAARSEHIRERVNKHLAHIWEVKTKRDKAQLKIEALSSRQAFQALLDALHSVKPRAYDLNRDPDGRYSWLEALEFADRFPLDLGKPREVLTLEAVHKMVQTIIGQFRTLIEHKGLNKLLYRPDGTPHREDHAQRLFFAVAFSYCQANDVDISPEMDTGNGYVDFKFSTGASRRVLVELKLSTNTKLVSGHETQLEVYKASEQTMKAWYLVIDVGKMGKKLKKLEEIRNVARTQGRVLSELAVIDGIIKPPASKR